MSNKENITILSIIGIMFVSLFLFKWGVDSDLQNQSFKSNYYESEYKQIETHQRNGEYKLFKKKKIKLKYKI